MNITNLEITQATVDMFFCCFCVIMSVTIKNNNSKSKSMKIFLQLFITASLLFLGEAAAYIFRGNLGAVNTALTWASNLVVFFANIEMIYLYVRYVYLTVNDGSIDEKAKGLIVAKVLTCVNLLIVIINLFTNWMYYFDEANYYHRNSMWYVYTVISLIIVFTGAGVGIINRKKMDSHRLISTVLFSFIPIIATVVQMFIYGISVTNMGVGIGVFILFASYLYDWTHDSNEQIEQFKNKRFDGIVLFVIMLLSMSASIIACGAVIQQVSNDNSEMQSKTIAQMVASGIENEFIKPITVAQTLSQDPDIRLYIDTDRDAAETVTDAMSEHLEAVRAGFGYQMAFVASDKSKAYYTYKGINKYLDVDNDSHDIWYKNFIETGKTYELNVDTDEVNDEKLAVFINYKIEDEEGNFAGACGVGVDMVGLMELISTYEKDYNIKISIVNPDGLMQISSDYGAIETTYVDNSYYDKVSKNGFYYLQSDGSCQMTKYIEMLDWYLVVEDDNPAKIDVNRILSPIVLIFAAGIIIMGLSFGLISIREMKATEAYQRRYEVSIKDELTGLYNRRGYEVDCDCIEKDGTLNQYSIIMADLNGLKAANDNIGHEAGDELIIAAAKCMNNAFSGIGKAYRVGGDEFVILLNCSKDKVNDVVTSFDYLCANYKGKLISELSISKGVVICAEHPELSFDEMKAMADKLMYADKDAYYIRTGKKRRTI